MATGSRSTSGLAATLLVGGGVAALLLLFARRDRPTGSSPAYSTGQRPTYSTGQQAGARNAGLGDSLIAHGGCLRTLERLVGGTWVNHGVVGQSTPAIQARAVSQVAPQRYATVIVLAGVNDLASGRSAESIERNLTSIYGELRGSGARVVAVTVTPWQGHARSSTRKQFETLWLNDWIMRFGPNAVDAFTPLAEPNSRRLRAEYSAGDWLHLNVAGQDKLGRIVAERAFGRI